MGWTISWRTKEDPVVMIMAESEEGLWMRSKINKIDSPYMDHLAKTRIRRGSRVYVYERENYRDFISIYSSNTDLSSY